MSSLLHEAATEVTADEIPTPDLPDGLEPVRPLGKGAMAHVFLAREKELGRLVAVKVLRPELATDETARARFEREARSAASLSHPNVVSVYRYGRLDDDTPYLVMTYVKGRSLADRLKAEGRFSESEAREVLTEIASALAEAHRHGIVHRDVRPDNVLFEKATGRALLTDFGIAGVLDSDGGESKLTRTGQILGQPQYGSPEQLSGEPVTAQADIYSLAVTGYELLAGRGPFPADSRQQWIAAHLSEEPDDLAELRPGVDPGLADLLMRCLAKEPSHRPTAEDVIRSLSESTGAGASETRGVQGGEGGIVGLIEDLRRRRLVQFVLVAVGLGYGLTEFADILIQNDILAPGSFPLVLNAAAFGVMASGVVAWFHGQPGRQRTPTVERWILGVLAAAWLAVSVLLVMT